MTAAVLGGVGDPRGALLAGIVGLVCGYFIAAALLPDVAASLRGLYGAQIPGQLTLKPEWWIAGLAISVIGALAAGTTSLLKAIRLPILATALLGFSAWRVLGTEASLSAPPSTFATRWPDREMPLVVVR